MVDFTFWKPFVLVGVILATWSASQSNMIGGSRVLQAVAEDIMFGPFLSFINKGTRNNNPITAVIATFVWVELVFLMGGLNQIAQVT
jgi:amino acid permease